MTRIAVVLMAAMAGLESASAQNPVFEVASVKIAPPPVPGAVHFFRPTGPGTADPTRYSCEGCSLMNLLMNAYKLGFFQVSGPAWLRTELYDLQARVPAGATKQDLDLMIQALIKERFGMQAHREQRESPVYELVVDKGAPKLKEHQPLAAGAKPGALPFEDGGRPLGKRSDGMPQLPPGRTMSVVIRGVQVHQGFGETAESIAALCSNELSRVVVDRTGLKGKYDYIIKFASAQGVQPRPGGEDSASDQLTAPGLARAVREQLGLRLEQSKGQVDMLVIDRIEKTPAEN